MKRDMDLARQIMMRISEQEEYNDQIPSRYEGHTPEEVSYHVMLLDEAGLIKAIDFSAGDGINWLPQRLTWQGHEFVDAARDPGVWAGVKGAAATAGGVGFQLLMPLLVEYSKARLRTMGLLP